MNHINRASILAPRSGKKSGPRAGAGDERHARAGAKAVSQSRAGVRAKFPRIKKLTPRGFLSFAPDFPGVELGDLNVFIGANGSGKSNFFEAARFLQEAQSSLLRFLTVGGSRPSDFAFKLGETAGVSALFEMLEPVATADYSLDVIATEGGALVSEESLWLNRAFADWPKFHALERKGYQVAWLEPRGKRQPILRGYQMPQPEPALTNTIAPPSLQPHIQAFRAQLANWRFYSELAMGRWSNPLRKVQTTNHGDGRPLLEDGTNLFVKLSELLQRGLRDALTKHLQVVVQDAETFEVAPSQSGVQVNVLFRNRKNPVPAARLSDGTLRWLMLGVILLDDQDSAPLFLDEPESALHPDLIHVLGRLLREASLRRQIVVATHSSLLLSEFTSTPECVYAFHRDTSGTSVERLDPKLIRSWLNEGESLGSIWSAGAIGGNRW